MNDAERIKALQIANEYLNESIRLQAKAEQLLSTSYEDSNEKDRYVEQQVLLRNLNNYY